jgi:hypothetical protein
MLAGRNAYRGDGAGYPRVAEDVVGAGWLLDPPRVVLGESFHVLDGLLHLPDLVGVHHELPIGPDLLPDDARPARVVLHVGVEAGGVHRIGVGVDEALLVAEHAGDTDLLADASLATTFNERRQGGVGPRVAYLRASSPRTRSTLVVDRPGPLVLEVTWRLPAELPAGSVSVTVNGHQVGTAEPGTSWATREFTVAPDVLRRGRNTVEIRWPDGGDGNDTIVARAAARLECGESVPNHQVHGHVHSWSVARGAPTAV